MKLLTKSEFKSAPEEAELIEYIDKELHVKFSLDTEGRVHFVYVIGEFGGRDVALLTRFRSLRELSVVYFPEIRKRPPLTPLGLSGINQSLRLTTIHFQNLSVSKLFTKTLARNDSIRRLGLWDCSVTDSVMRELCHATRLVDLDVRGNPVTDAAIPCLSELRDLRHLCLTDTNVREDAVKSFRKLHPRCAVNQESSPPRE